MAKGKKTPRTQRLGWLLALCVALLFFALAPLSIARLGYLFEASFPFTFEHSSRVVVSPDNPTVLIPTNPVGPESPGVFSSGWWPKFALHSRGEVHPILTEAYQGSWPYYFAKLFPRGTDGLDGTRRFSSFLGALALLLVFGVALKSYGAGSALWILGVVALNSFYLLAFATGYLYEALPIPLIFLAGGLAVRERESPRLLRGIFIGLLVGLAASLKATAAVPGVVLVIAILGPKRIWRRSSLPMALAAIPPLLPYLWHEVHCLVSGVTDSSMFATLMLQKARINSPGDLFAGLIRSIAMLFGTGFGSPRLYAPLFGVESWQTTSGVLSLAVGGVATLWAAVTVLRGRGTIWLRGAVASGASVVVLSTLLYRSDLDMQGFLHILPLSALVLVEFGMWARGILSARFANSRLPLLPLLLLIAVAAGQMAASLTIARNGVSPVLRRPQETVALAAADSGRTVVTTAYNQAGMVSFLSHHRAKEVHADLLLSPGADDGVDVRSILHRDWTLLLDAHPGAVFIFELSPMNLDAIRSSLGESRSSLVLDTFLTVVKERGGRPVTLATGLCDGGEPILLALTVDSDPRSKRP